MNIAVLGATGMAGSVIVTEALMRGHHAIALSRHPDTNAASDKLTTLALDVTDTEALTSMMTDIDTAALAIRLAQGHEHRLAPLTQGVLDAAAATGVRVLVVGGSSPLRSPDDPGKLIIETSYVPAEYQAVAQASLDQFRVCQRHPYDGWVYLSPPAVLEPGTRTGRYRRGSATLLVNEDGTSRITASDLAVAALDEIENPAGARHLTVVCDAPG